MDPRHVIWSCINLRDWSEEIRDTSVDEAKWAKFKKQIEDNPNPKSYDALIEIFEQVLAAGESVDPADPEGAPPAEDRTIAVPSDNHFTLVQDNLTSFEREGALLGTLEKKYM